jgi:hypothetical protein
VSARGAAACLRARAYVRVCDAIGRRLRCKERRKSKTLCKPQAQRRCSAAAPLCEQRRPQTPRRPSAATPKPQACQTRPW